MKERPLRTNVIGSYPLPAWLELAAQHLPELGEADRAELFDEAVVAALHDQLRAERESGRTPEDRQADGRRVTERPYQRAVPLLASEPPEPP